jgi:hypothetical protein
MLEDFHGHEHFASSHDIQSISQPSIFDDCAFESTHESDFST